MVVVNEQDQYDTVSAMGQSMRSMNSSKYKDLPSPPLNQQQQQSYLSKLEGNHSVADDVSLIWKIQILVRHHRYF